MWKTKLFRLLEDNVSEYLCNFDTGKNSLNKTHKAQIKKEKTNSTILKLRILLSKDTIQGLPWWHSGWESAC